MKPFHVYGIGNALLDIDFEVNEATLHRLNIDKGVMTLIDENKHHALMQEFSALPHLKACGGSAANTLYTMQQMGARTFYSCKIGNDEWGDFYFKDLMATGIHTNLHECGRDGITGKCIVLVTPDADRTMNTYLGATTDFSINELSENALKSADYLYIEGYLVAQPTALEAAIKARHLAKENDIKVALTLSDPNMVRYFKDGLINIIGNPIDILFCNEQEALLFTETTSLNQAKQKLKDYAKTFVITLGEKGAMVYNGHDFYIIPAYKVNILDTVGAGDIFAGIFLYSITHGYDYYEAGNLANYGASKIVSKFGPRLTLDEVRDVKNNLQRAIA